jgi:hypothetical protein
MKMMLKELMTLLQKWIKSRLKSNDQFYYLFNFIIYFFFEFDKLL